MKSFISIFVILIISSCSFDNKTGIWNDASVMSDVGSSTRSVNDTDQVDRYEYIFSKEKLFNEEKNLYKSSNFKLAPPIRIDNWLEEYGSKTNNISNYLYSGNKTLLSKSPRLSKSSLDKNIIFYKNNLVNYDHKGKIFIYSLSVEKKIFEYDFYKGNFKKFKKEMYLAISNDILYIADNLGYLYAVDLINRSLIWAKNYGIPFRSNIKITNGQLLLANQDNVIYSININNGDKNWQYATTLTFLKVIFKNNIAIDEVNKNLFFLNTSGELYSINYLEQKINWLINFKNASVKTNSDLFLSHPIVFKNDNLIISTEKSILNYNSNSGVLNWSFPSDSILKPILTNNYVYIFSKNNLLICLDNKSGEVLWSKNIYKDLKNEKIGKFNDFKMVNNKINFFSSNGYLLSFNYSNGYLEYMKKISKKGISSVAIFVKENMILVDQKSKLLKFN
ncbi:PQQ-binding-like beta-propeller repeat protein [Pelagibacteraceae bacterium]|nr:PQQ-binding-like beta-propeller repeat protein [Pelagibacteraceae bacterium]